MNGEMKQRIAGVICEYNPMHEGHRAMLAAVRGICGEDALIACVMSGDFVQRGEPAVYDKYKRAEEAAKGGADVVFELPYPWSCSVAEHFAAGGVEILHRSGATDIFFGSEGKDEDELKRIALRLCDPGFKKALAAERKRVKNESFPRQNERVYAEYYGEPLALLPNEILAVQYLTAIEKSGAEIAPHAYPIIKGYSASAIRQGLSEDRPADSAALVNGERAILAMLSLSERKDRFAKVAPYCATLGELLEKVRNPADTDARLRRELIGTLLSCTGEEEKRKPAFTVLLAANERGLKLPAALRKSKDFTVVTKQTCRPKNGDAPGQFALYERARRLYATFTAAPRPANFLALKHPYIGK